VGVQCPSVGDVLMHSSSIVYANLLPSFLRYDGVNVFVPSKSFVKPPTCVDLRR